LKAPQNPVSKIESIMQFLFEDFWERIFPSPLESVEVVHKLVRFMDSQRFLLSDGRYVVPHVYDIYLSPRDHQLLSPNQNVLLPDWQNQLIDYAKHHHYVLRDTPVLRLHPDSSLKMGNLRFEVGSAGGQNGGIGDTQQLDPAQVAAMIAQAPQIPTSSPSTSASAQQGPAQATPGFGATNPGALVMPAARLLIRLPQSNPQTYNLTKPVVSIGRQLDNDIIVEDKRVSRYHAQIKYQADGQFALFDLGSTNGITINGRPNMRQHILRNNDHFMIGSYDFEFRR
jgi:hypothetical protein